MYVLHKILLPDPRRRRAALPTTRATHGEGAKHVEPGQGRGNSVEYFVRTYAVPLTLLVVRIRTDKLEAEKRQNIRSRDQEDGIDTHAIFRTTLTERVKGNTKM